jgi:hypothetical protein
MEALLYVADDIQPLPNGKALMVGVYPDRVVVINVPKDNVTLLTKETPGAIHALAFMSSVSNVQSGEHTIEIRVLAPDGSDTKYHLGPSKQTALGGAALNTVMRCQPFVFPLAGVYKFLTVVDGEVIESSFELRVVEVNSATQETAKASS